MRRTLGILLLLLGEFSWGRVSKVGSASIRAQAAKAPFAQSQYSLIVPSFVIHGLKPTAESSDSMSRKIDDNGNMVITPGLGFEYRSQEGFLGMTGVIKDCYNHWGATVQIGRTFAESKDSHWGFTVGVYARETPMACKIVNGVRKCSSVDDYPLKFDSTFNGVPLDIMPMPFLHYTATIFKDRDLQVDFRLLSNFFLNEFGVSVPL